LKRDHRLADRLPDWEEHAAAGGKGAAAAGWIVFAAWMLILVGAFDIIAGLVAIINGNFYLTTGEYLLQLNVTTWGWIKLIIGIILVTTGFGLSSGAIWARTLGVIVAIVSFAWLPWYPCWALVVLAIDLTVICALTAHGRVITRIWAVQRRAVLPRFSYATGDVQVAPAAQHGGRVRALGPLRSAMVAVTQQRTARRHHAGRRSPTGRTARRPWPTGTT
jgi:hypothetical protein